MSSRPESSGPLRAAAVGVAKPQVEEPETADATDDGDPSDHFRHIICVQCYPAFNRSREAPHDAVCICGKRLNKGDTPAPSDAAQCILCNEMWKHHLDTVHSNK
jgi:hypothetical protein